MNTDLDLRTGLPQELYVFLTKYPRDTWASSHSDLARFWVYKHNDLREQSVALIGANGDYREQRSTATQFGAWIAPRLQRFLGELHGHHQIEDHQYFPAFRTAAPSLVAGFDVLASDHELVHAGILQIIETVNTLLTTIDVDLDVDPGADNDADALRVAVDRYIDASEIMHTRLSRHLEDEEDLLIPVMLENNW